jgi:hypothetical protein
MKSPILRFMREVLEDHIEPLEDDASVGLVTAPWLLDMIHAIEEHYRQHG